MLKKAVEFREKEGDEAMYQWFNSLSDADKNKFLEELEQSSETTHAAFTNFREAVIYVFNKMFPHINKSVLNALSEVLQNESAPNIARTGLSGTEAADGSEPAS